MTRALVTGASGFIGRFAVESLRDVGFHVNGTARQPLRDLRVDAWHAADLLEPSAAARVVREADASHLLHLAWTTEHARYWDDPANLEWVSATRRLVEAFAETGGSRVVLAGSCAQYEWGDEEPFSEADTPRRPATLYGRAKQEAAELLETLSTEMGFSYATALLFFPYGPNEQPDRLVPSIARHLLAGEEAPVSAGTQVRDFLHVADCGGALAALLAGEALGPINVGTGKGVSVAEVAESVARIAGHAELLRLGALPGDDGTRVVARTARLRDEVGFVPRLGLEEGLRDAVEWWRQRTRRR